ncbi:proline-rich protein 2-like isoform X1 [Rhipicephalus sanguineus]|uniref:proline-rich protein 2-like isoform X1 n=1 Tax=Rhipicephalus sanguineus TaxID=34632 RepID=UPI001894AEC3|nr:proline-rich protein 2-like isoform X1 [Rhipicephalus sanguineus]
MAKARSFRISVFLFAFVFLHSAMQNDGNSGANAATTTPRPLSPPPSCVGCISGLAARLRPQTNPRPQHGPGQQPSSGQQPDPGRQSSPRRQPVPLPGPGPVPGPPLPSPPRESPASPGGHRPLGPLGRQPSSGQQPDPGRQSSPSRQPVPLPGPGPVPGPPPPSPPRESPASPGGHRPLGPLVFRDMWRRAPYNNFRRDYG